MTDPGGSTDTLAPQTLTVDGVDLKVAPLGGFELTDHLVLVKPMAAVEAYREVLDRHRGSCMVELGIAYGGSVAYNALVAEPRLLVAMELHGERIALLDQLLEERGFGDRVQLHYGVDQSDGDRVRRLATDALAGRPLDLVIDDASHLYGPTVASFTALFPLLRPGGTYVIEDWACDHDIRRLLEAALADPASPQHQWATQAAQGALRSRHEGQPSQAEVAIASLGLLPPDGGSVAPPLSRLAAELALAPADPRSGVASVTTNGFWIAVERNDTPLDPATYTFDRDLLDPFGAVTR